MGSYRELCDICVRISCALQWVLSTHFRYMSQTVPPFLEVLLFRKFKIELSIFVVVRKANVKQEGSNNTTVRDKPKDIVKVFILDWQRTRRAIEKELTSLWFPLQEVKDQRRTWNFYPSFIRQSGFFATQMAIWETGQFVTDREKPTIRNQRKGQDTATEAMSDRPVLPRSLRSFFCFALAEFFSVLVRSLFADYVVSSLCWPSLFWQVKDNWPSIEFIQPTHASK